MRKGFASVAAVALIVSVARAELDVTLGNGDTVRGTISPAAQTETFRVTCPAGARLSVALATTVRTHAKTSTLAFHVFDPAGTDVGSGAGAGAKTQILLTKSGEYRVVVGTGGASTDDYRLAVSWRDATRASFGVPLPPGGVNTFLFAAEAGSDVNLRVAPAKKSRALPAIVRIEDENHVGIDLDASKTTFHVPVTATYTVTVIEKANAPGDCVASASIRPPRATRRALAATSKEIPDGLSVVAASVIGPLGGVVDAPFSSALPGARVTVPAHAFARPTIVALGVAADVVPPNPVHSTYAGVAAFVAPFGRQFSSTLVTPTLRLPYVTSGSVPALATLRVYMAPDATDVLELLGGTLDEPNSLVSFKTARFARFQTYFVDETPATPVFATDGDVNGDIGRALAVAGGFVYAGQPDDIGAGVPGKVRIFERAGATMTERAALAAPAVETGGGFGSSIVLQKDVLPGPTSRLLVYDRGYSAVHVYTGSGAGWTLETSLKPPTADATAADYWGVVAADGDTVAFTAAAGPASAFPGSRQVVYVFRKGAAGWQLEQTLTPSRGYVDATITTPPMYGLALSGDALLVAAPLDGSVSPSTDMVIPFSRAAGVWTAGPSVTEPPPAPKSNLFAFGPETVAVAGDAFVTASAGAHDGASLGALVFGGRAGGVWTIDTKIAVAGTPRIDPFSSNPSPFRDASWCCAMQGTRAAFASWNVERVIVCEKRLGAWKRVYDLDASTSLGPAAFASRVALDGDLVVVGARNKQNAAKQWIGAIAVFDLAQ